MDLDLDSDVDVVDHAKPDFRYSHSDNRDIRRGVPEIGFCMTGYIGGGLDTTHIPNERNLDDDSYWMDIRPDQVSALLKILDTERRRVLKRFGSRAGAVSDRVRYAVDGLILTRQEVEPGYYAKASFKINLR